MDGLNLDLARSDASLLAEYVSEYVAMNSNGVTAAPWKIMQKEEDIRLLVARLSVKLGNLRTVDVPVSQSYRRA